MKGAWGGVIAGYCLCGLGTCLQGERDPRLDRW